MKHISMLIATFLLNIFSVNGAASPISPSAPSDNSSQLLQTFTAVQKICAFTKRHVAPATDSSVMINPLYHQTKQGLFMAMSSYPRALCTPWGSVSLYGPVITKDSAGLHETTRDFFKNFTLEFAGFDGDCYGEAKFYLVLEDLTLTPLHADDIPLYRGTNQPIFCTCPTLLSIYRVTAVDTIKLPEPIARERQDYLHQPAIQQSLREMMQKSTSATALPC